MLPPKPAGGTFPSVVAWPKTPTKEDFDKAGLELRETLAKAQADGHIDADELKQISASMQNVLTLASNYLSDTWNKVPPEDQRALHQEFDTLYRGLTQLSSSADPKGQFGVLEHVMNKVTTEWIAFDRLYPAPPELSPKTLGQRLKDFGQKVADLFHEPQPSAKGLEGASARTEPSPQQAADQLWK